MSASESPITQFTVILPDRPGELAALTALLARAGVRVEGLIAFKLGDSSLVRLLTAPHPTPFTGKLEANGWTVVEGPALTLPAQSDPGFLSPFGKSDWSRN